MQIWRLSSLSSKTLSNLPVYYCFFKKNNSTSKKRIYLIQQEANTFAKYIPALNEPAVFYKKTRSEKTEGGKAESSADN
jgi:hypothetical protein